jgi:L-serine dehydratase
MDIFEIIGPIMVGPSSSHTAGAVRIGLVARKLLGKDPIRAELGLHGSFAATGRGHGTDRALIAGLLGFEPDDARIPDSFSCAEERGLRFRFDTIQLRDAHPNSVQLRLWEDPEKPPLTVVGASVGGGRIEIREFNGIKLCFSAEVPTLIVKNRDNPGSVADVSYLISRRRINIATFQVNRSSRGGEAVMVIECDTPIQQELVDSILSMPDIMDVVGINP